METLSRCKWAIIDFALTKQWLFIYIDKKRKNIAAMNQTLQGQQPDSVATHTSDIDDHDFAQVDNGIFARLRNKLRAKRSGLLEKFSKLTFSQWMYLLAFFSLFFTAETDSESLDSFMTAGIIAGIGLIRELWQLFMRIWAHTAGKGLLFVLYAATANFALAVSALKINSISGVEPTVFIFTMGFATLLMLPFWLIVASMVFLGTALMLASTWFFITLLLRLIKIKLPMHWEDQSFAVLTLILRIILIPALLFALANMINPYIEQMDMFDDPVDFHVTGINITDAQAEKIRKLPKREIAAALQDAEFEAQLRKRLTGQIDDNSRESLNTDNLTPIQKEVLQALADTTEEPADGANNEDDSASPEKASDKAAGLKWLDIMISQFIYRFETYPYSACAKQPQQRVLTINENLVFVAERDDAYETGIKFSAIECVPRNSVHEKGLKQEKSEALTDEKESDENPAEKNPVSQAPLTNSSDKTTE